MIKILYVTFMTPSVKFGGGLGVLKSLEGLCSFAKVDYIGPSYNDEDIAGYDFQLEHSYYISLNSSKFKRVKNYILHGSGSGFYDSWKKTVHSIDISKYDLVYLERTLQSFAAKWAKKANKKLLVMTHNAEADFMRTNSSEISSVKKFLQAVNAKTNEKKCMKYADCVAALTANDRKRLIELYGCSEKIVILPVCIKGFRNTEKFENGKPYILLTGSLWFGPNEKGTLWFLEKVWRNIDEKTKDKMDVIIAGSSPTDEIRRACSSERSVRLVENPKDMSAYFNGASVFAAPIFEGAGMKVKIAEALSCGLRVITTSHGSIGYETVHSYMDICKDRKSFIKAVVKQINDQDGSKMQSSIKKKFDQEYSIAVFSMKMERLVLDVCGEINR